MLINIDLEKIVNIAKEVAQAIVFESEKEIVQYKNNKKNLFFIVKSKIL